MTGFMKTALAATVATLAFGAASAFATPVAPKDVIAPASGIEKTARVCDAWGRCWWTPGPYYGGGYYGGYRGGYYGGYRRGYYGHGWGYHGGYRGWRGGGHWHGGGWRGGHGGHWR